MRATQEIPHVALLAHHVQNCVRKRHQIQITPDKHVLKVAQVALTEKYACHAYIHADKLSLTTGKHKHTQVSGQYNTPEKHAILAHVALPYN